MAGLVVALAFIAFQSGSGLTTSYVHELRAEVALADHLVIRTSQANGGFTRSTNDLAEIHRIAKLFPKDARVLPSEGNVSSTDYATISLYEAADSESPSYNITVMPTHCAFRVNNKVYEVKTQDAALYNAVVKAATQNNR